MSPRWALPLICLAVTMLLAVPLPVLDEGSYLAIAAQLDPLHPYDWWRAWPPWDGGREADAFVFAHPPGFLWWTHLWSRGLDAAHAVGPVKVAAGVAPSLLLGWSAGRLAERLCRRPWLFVAAWITAPVTLLGLSRGLMPDLMLTALMAYAAVAWMEGLAARPDRARGWFIGAGVALAAATWVKYPGLVLAPALLLHGLRLGRLRDTRWTWGVLLGLLTLGEGWLALSYGRLHLWEVLSRAGEIPHGPLPDRALGVAVRLALCGVGLAVVGGLRPRRLAVAVVGAAAAGGLLLSPELPGLAVALVIGLGALGLSLVLGSLGAAADGWRLVREDSPVDPDATEVLLGVWVLAVVLGVVLGHNYAAPRYLLPATLPLALLAVRALGSREGPAMLVGVVLQGALAIGLLAGERAFFQATDEQARELVRRPEAGQFTGEWTFRWRLEEAGWAFVAVGEPAPGLMVVPTMSAPGPVDRVSWTRAGRRESVSDFPLKVMQPSPPGPGQPGGFVGLYAETIGPVPFWWDPGTPLEVVDLWEVP